MTAVNKYKHETDGPPTWTVMYIRSRCQQLLNGAIVLNDLHHGNSVRSCRCMQAAPLSADASPSITSLSRPAVNASKTLWKPEVADGRQGSLPLEDSFPTYPNRRDNVQVQERIQDFGRGGSSDSLEDGSPPVGSRAKPQEVWEQVSQKLVIFCKLYYIDVVCVEESKTVFVNLALQWTVSYSDWRRGERGFALIQRPPQ